MTAAPVPGTEGYAEEAETLIERYESADFEALHGPVRHLFPDPPSRVLDVGAGSGRDAAAFAALGHRVLAVEPTAPLREAARALHPSPRIEWLDDSLPALSGLRDRGPFALIMVTAVWMHLDADQRGQALPVLAGLLGEGGSLILTYRLQPSPPQRRFFAVPAAETIALARAAGLAVTLDLETPSLIPGKTEVRWVRLAFTKDGAVAPDDP